MINPRVPLVDFTKDAVMSHVAFCSLHRFRDQHNRLPKPRSEQYNNDDVMFFKLIKYEDRIIKTTS